MRSTQALVAISAIAVGLCVQTNSSDNGSAALLSSGHVDLGISTDAYTKAEAFVARLTNAQKVAIITGESLTGENGTWKALENKDGVASVNMQFSVSGFTMPNALGMTWDPALIRRQFRAVGDEFYGMGYNLVNGPEPGPLGRTPYGGRSPETFGPDPYLTGISMGEAITGMNSAGVVTVGRHFLLNEQETNRMSGGGMGGGGGSGASSDSYSSNAADKTAQELYIWPFADGVRAGMMAVMCGMNRVNATYSCENSKLLNKYLKSDLGFPGLVMPDVSSQKTSFGSANGGLDFGSSSYWTTEILEAGISNGSFTQARLDDMTVRNVIGYYHAGLDDGRQPEVAGTTEFRNVRRDHAKLIRKASAESIALLRNKQTGDGRGLPLKKPRTIALFGAHAGPCLAGPNQAFSVMGSPSEVYQGHLVGSVGSGSLSLPYLITPFNSLTTRAVEDGSMIWWVMNNTYSDTSSSPMGSMPDMGSNGTSTGSSNSSAPATPGGGGMGGGMGGGGGGGGGMGALDKALPVTPSIDNYALNAEVCIAFLNSFSGEGADRSKLSDDEQDAMVNTVANSCNNTVVVVNTSGPRILDTWVEHENVTAVLYTGLLGQESGNAIADVLYGDVNPAAKLTHTIAKSADDYPAKVCNTTICEFSEGVNIDYRWFDAKNRSVRYPFGHGLSYTSFEYGRSVDVRVTDKAH